MLTRYQYTQAMEHAGGDAGKVDIEKFRYPGPRPRSRETALLMLADACEARSRAENPNNEEKLREIVRSVVEIVERDGQLDNTQLTLHDLNLITESFVTTLRGPITRASSILLLRCPLPLRRDRTGEETRTP